MPKPVFKSNITTSIGRFFTTAVDEFPPGVITASDTLSDLCGNENVKLYQTANSCATNSPLYFIANIEDPTYLVDEAYYENEFGQKELKSRVVVPRMRIAFNCDTYIRSLVYKMISENNELLVDFETGWIGKVAKNFEIDNDEEDFIDDSKFFFMQLSFEVDSLTHTGTTPCCEDSVYSEAPYATDCSNVPDDPTSCAALSINLTRSGDTITLNVTGAYGSPTSEWSLTPSDGGSTINLGTNITSIIPPEYGTVQVVYSVGGCVKIATLLYSDECSGFDVSISLSGNVLSANVPASHDPADSFQWAFSADGNTWSNLTTDQDQIVTEGDGFYRVTTVKGDCTDVTIREVTAAEACDITGTIEVDGNVLTFDTESTGYTYQWSLDTGSGSTPISGATSQSHTATESGLYSVTVTSEDCSITVTKVHIMCADCAAFTAEVTNSGDTITATVTGCSVPTYQWYAVNGDGTKDLLPEIDEDYILPADGLYFLVVCCEACNAKVYLISKVGSTIIITDNSLSGGYAWGGLV